MSTCAASPADVVFEWVFVTFLGALMLLLVIGVAAALVSAIRGGDDW